MVNQSYAFDEADVLLAEKEGDTVIRHCFFHGLNPPETLRGERLTLPVPSYSLVLFAYPYTLPALHSLLIRRPCKGILQESMIRSRAYSRCADGVDSDLKPDAASCIVREVKAELSAA